MPTNISMAPDLSKWLPIPQVDLEVVDGRLGLRNKVKLRLGDDYFNLRQVHYTWLSMYETMAKKMAGVSMGVPGYIVTRYKAQVDRDYSINPDVVDLKLFVDIFVAQTANVTVPEIVYEKNSNKIIEWRCGYCQTPNPITNRSCDKCGAPRAMLYHEMEFEIPVWQVQHVSK